jgi:hypothetical protein
LLIAFFRKKFLKISRKNLQIAHTESPIRILKSHFNLIPTNGFDCIYRKIEKKLDFFVLIWLNNRVGTYSLSLYNG